MGLQFLLDGEAISLQVSFGNGLTGVLISTGRSDGDGDRAATDAYHGPGNDLSALATRDVADELGEKFWDADPGPAQRGGHIKRVRLPTVAHRSSNHELLLGGEGLAFSGSCDVSHQVSLELLLDGDAIRHQVSLRDGFTSVLVGASRGHGDGDISSAGADQGPAHLSAITTSDEAYLPGGGLTLRQLGTTDHFYGDAHIEGVRLAGVGDGGGDDELLLGGESVAFSGC